MLSGSSLGLKDIRLLTGTLPHLYSLNMKEAHLFVRPRSKRPDFRVAISFLWSDKANCDSDGDSHNPASRDWTELDLCNRGNESERIGIERISDNPLTLKITSSTPDFCPAVAYFLVRETNGEWSASEMGPFRREDQELVDMIGKAFDLESALERAAMSIWRKSNIGKPVPQHYFLRFKNTSLSICPRKQKFRKPNFFGDSNLVGIANENILGELHVRGILISEACFRTVRSDQKTSPPICRNANK